MATKPKRWPNQMAWARDNAAEACQAALRQIQPLLNHRDITVVARAGIASSHLQEALRNLEHAGAATRPTNQQ